MKLDLSEILSRVGMRYAYTVDEPPLVDEDLECTQPIRGNVVFTNTGEVLLIEGAADTAVALPCSRCLVYYEHAVHIEIDEQFTLHTRPAASRARQPEVEVEEDDNPDAGRLFDGPMFDLTELLRQDINIALPSQPLHAETCKGLCAQCGKDLNEGPCDCKDPRGNTALQALADLRKAVAEEESEQGEP